MKEARKYLRHHRMQIGGMWFVPYERATDAVDIAVEEGRIAFRKETNNEPPEKKVTAGPDIPQ